MIVIGDCYCYCCLLPIIIGRTISIRDRIILISAADIDFGGNSGAGNIGGILITVRLPIIIIISNRNLGQWAWYSLVEGSVWVMVNKLFMINVQY